MTISIEDARRIAQILPIALVKTMAEAVPEIDWDVDVLTGAVTAKPRPLDPDLEVADFATSRATVNEEFMVDVLTRVATTGSALTLTRVDETGVAHTELLPSQAAKRFFEENEAQHTRLDPPVTGRIGSADSDVNPVRPQSDRTERLQRYDAKGDLLELSGKVMLSAALGHIPEITPARQAQLDFVKAFLAIDPDKVQARRRTPGFAFDVFFPDGAQQAIGMSTVLDLEVDPTTFAVLLEVKRRVAAGDL